MIYEIHPPALAWTSPKWAAVLRDVTDSAVRLTEWWRVGRKRLLCDGN